MVGVCEGKEMVGEWEGEESEGRVEGGEEGIDVTGVREGSDAVGVEVGKTDDGGVEGESVGKWEGKVEGKVADGEIVGSVYPRHSFAFAANDRPNSSNVHPRTKLKSDGSSLKHEQMI